MNIHVSLPFSAASKHPPSQSKTKLLRKHLKNFDSHRVLKRNIYGWCKQRAQNELRRAKRVRATNLIFAPSCALPPQRTPPCATIKGKAARRKQPYWKRFTYFPSLLCPYSNFQTYLASAEQQ